jgi:predicted ATP-dependent endonuclease of OLD family
MLLKTVFIRFYKSFNDDFLRKNDSTVNPKPWEKIGDAFYPYIEVPIDSKITTVVGANESGKSHLLSAIEKSISGEDIKRSDFCRYSPFFTVRQNELKYPDFGSEWCSISASEKRNIREIVPGIHEDFDFDKFYLFRENANHLKIYIIRDRKYKSYSLNSRQAERFRDLLPNTFKIESNIALPSSVPIRKLVELGQDDYFDNRKFEILDREQRNNIIEALDVFSDNPEVIKKFKFYGEGEKETIEREAVDSIKAIISALDQVNYSVAEMEKREKEFQLAYKLICKIAQVDINALTDLSEAIKDGKQGYANGIIEKINRQLAINLNFPNYWVQDRNFSLKVMARDYDLVFTITDRTGTEYSFDERSQGLRFFLSYYIEYRSHEPHPNKAEILLMDEPDAYLSSQAQQDLLRVFDLFANPNLGSHLPKPIQVVYVTHSPFLIDKNHTERIRVLQKGNEDEGTRVVKDFAKSRYEPLRSSIGPHIGESVFIGNCNLMVEGIGDQITIAGAARHLRNKGVSKIETLDLNQITIVNSEGATQVPYMVYLACGRHAEQIAVIVLLDSDNSGNDAKEQLLEKGKGRHKKSLLKEQFILQLADLASDFLLSEEATSKLEIEDIIPVEICLQATKFYLYEFLRLEKEDLDFLTEDLILEKRNGKTILDAIKISLGSSLEGRSISKAGFARNVIRVVNEWSSSIDSLDESQREALKKFEHNFTVLFKKLNSMQRRAQQQITKEKITQKIDRLIKNFLNLHTVNAMREDGIELLDEIEGILEGNTENASPQEIEETKNAIQNVRRDYKLDTDMSKAIDDYLGFQKGLERIKRAGLLASQEQISEEEFLEEDNEGLSTESISKRDFSEKELDENITTDDSVEDELKSKDSITSTKSSKENTEKKPNSHNR